MADVVTRAELARRLNLSRPRITQYIRAGLPIMRDGKLNFVEAVEWIKTHVDPSRGGWWGDLRPKRTGRRMEPMAAAVESGIEVEVKDLAELGDLPELGDLLAELGDLSDIGDLPELGDLFPELGSKTGKSA